MADSVDNDTSCRIDQIGDPQSDRVVIFECDVLESADGHKEADDADDRGRNANELKVFSE